MADDLRMLVERMKAVSHPLRMRVLGLLGQGELCVCQVAEVLAVPASSVSEALRELRRAGFVTERKEGRWVFVSIPVPTAPLLTSLLLEIEALPETGRDRARIPAIKGLPVQDVCLKHLVKAGEAAHV
jgi:DNA-binding transcriptional ArsR family regulator